MGRERTYGDSPPAEQRALCAPERCTVPGSMADQDVTMTSAPPAMPPKDVKVKQEKVDEPEQTGGEATIKVEGGAKVKEEKEFAKVKAEKGFDVDEKESAKKEDMKDIKAEGNVKHEGSVKSEKRIKTEIKGDSSKA